VKTSNERIRSAAPADVGVLLDLIKGLAEFEKLSHEVVATEELLHEQLFGAKPSAEVLICEIKENDQWLNAGFALFFTSFSTFLAKPGIYLEDLYIKPELRSRGLGKKMLTELARIAVSRGCRRLEWSVLDWNVRARAFYEGLGASPLTEWTVHRIAGPRLEKLANS
jgi:ribosomal protein S18 acetylase RimI-like enzyme